MSKKTKRAIIISAAAVVLAAAAVIIFLVARAGVKGYRSISIAEIFGKVITQNNGKTYEAYKNMRLADGYALTTDPESYTRMLLDDDKYVKLEQDSHAVFEALGDAKNHKTTIRLEKGALTSEITKPLSESESYVVNTPNAVLAVRGTMFRVEVKRDKNGDYYSDVYTFSGMVVSRRIMPDGTLVDEEVEIPSGYKATIKMDEIITVYLEEKIEEEEDNIDPINIVNVNDPTLVDVYNAAYHGHDMFAETSELWGEIKNRGIDLSQYKSVYDGSAIPAMDDKNSGTSSTESTNNSDYSVSASSSSAVSSSVSRPISSSSGSGETHEPIIVPDTSSSDEPVESSGEASVSRPAASSSRPASSSSRPASSSSRPASSSSRPASSSSRPASTSSEPETPPVVHTHTLTTTTAEPTCTQSGSKIVKCVDCGEIISEETLPPKGHTSVTETVKPATCTDEGEEIDKCSVCGGQLGKRTVPALGHTEKAVESNGIRTVTCSACGLFIKQVNIATGVEYPVALNETNFPDEKFREYVSENFDTDGNGYLSQTECDAVTSIDVRGTANIDGRYTSLRGVENFGKLQYLYCYYNSGLKELDVSKNTALEVFECYNTQIDSLDLSKNTALRLFNCSNTQITSLDVSKNIALKDLDCNNIPITSLNVSKNTALEYLACHNTQITSLDVSNNTALRGLWCFNTQIPFVDISSCTNISILNTYDNEHLIHVEDGVFDLNSIKDFDFNKVSRLEGADMDENGVLSGITEGTNITYTYDCGQGGSATFTLVPDESSTFAPETPETPEITYPVPIDEEHFPDEKFRTYVSIIFDKDSNGELSQEECDAVTSINVSGTESTDGGYTSLKGVENFGKLQTLRCYYNSGLKELDVSKNTALMHLNCSLTQIASLDVSKNTALTNLYCYNISITSLDVSKNTALTSLYCYNTPITSLDVSNNTVLTSLRCDYTSITALVISKNAALTYLDCSNTQITTLDVSKNTALTTLYCDGVKITSLDVSKNIALIHLRCGGTKLTMLDLSTNTDLDNLYCSNTQLPFVDISSCTNISDFTADGCEYPIHVENGVFDLNSIKDFDFNKVSRLEGADMDGNGVFSGITEGTNITYTYNCGQGRRARFTLVPDESSTFELPDKEGYVTINAKNFPDAKFREYVATNFDKDSDGYLSQSECDRVTSINVSSSSSDNGYTSLKGIENFSKLKALSCYNNSGLTELDVSKNTALLKLLCYNTQIAALDVSNNTELTQLWCYRTNISKLNVSNNIVLHDVNCAFTQISHTDVSNCPELNSFVTKSCEHTITITNSTFDLSTLENFDINRMSDLEGATLSGTLLTGITKGTNITYKYYCGQVFNDNKETFTLVPDESSTFAPADSVSALSDGGDDNTTPPPNAPEETDGAMNEDAALPPDNTENLRYLPLGILAPGANRKRKKLYVNRKAKI